MLNISLPFLRFCHLSWGFAGLLPESCISKSESVLNYRSEELSVGSCSMNESGHKLENIDENGPASRLPVSCVPPETPTESMEFLARSWSLSAAELSKALSNTPKPSFSSVAAEVLQNNSSTSSEESLLHPLPREESPPIASRDSEEIKELFLLHQALNPDFLSNQQLLKNGLYKSILRRKTMGRWLKDQKERKKQEVRTHNALLHAAVSVAGVSAAVAALATSSAMLPEMPASQHNPPSKSSAAVASAAALVASYCINFAEEMGADHKQILTTVNSAINARTSGDIMALTAGAATALRGAATLRARLEGTTTFTPAEGNGEEGKELSISTALNFVDRGGELLKRTRKGALHWKQVSFYINSNLQVVAKMKNTHMAGAFIKKKCIVYEVCCDIPPWIGRDSDESNHQKAYFGIKTTDRIIEFECKSEDEKQMWTDGIWYMLNSRANIT